MFGHLGFLKPSTLTNEEEMSEKISVIETIISEFDESKAVNIFHHFVHTASFEEELVYEVLEYNPYTIFRWTVDSSNPWGIGIGRANKHLIQDLNAHLNKRAEHRDKIVNPPINFYGDRALMMKSSLKAGAVNWGGDWTDSNKMGIQPVNLATNLIPIDQDINDCRERIKKAFMAQPLGDVGDITNRSATEMSLRHEMFRKEFSGTYELLNTELLEPTFMDAYKIIEKKGLLESLENNDYVTHSQIHYVNELTQSAGKDRALQVLEFYNIVAQVLPETQKWLVIKTGEFVEYVRDKLRIPLDIVNNAKEMQALIENQQRLQEIQMLSQAQADVGKRAETGIPTRIQQGVEGLDEF